jgi:hypothetical protein
MAVPVLKVSPSAAENDKLQVSFLALGVDGWSLNPGDFGRGIVQSSK